MTPEQLAIKFHETYERLAPQFGYETRKETRAFDPTTPNGQLMIAVCGELMGDVSPAPAATVTGEKECECCEYRHGISSHFFHVCCGLCKHPIFNPKGEKLYVGFESVDAWQEGRRLTPPALTDAMRALLESVDHAMPFLGDGTLLKSNHTERHIAYAELRSAVAAVRVVVEGETK